MTMFDNNLTREARKALTALKEQGMTKLILDLRNNPGGALPAATGVADLLLPQGLTITDVEMHYKPSIGGIQIPGMGGDQTYTTKTRSDFEEMPMVLLINNASASASELLAGALQDHKRGKLIGETTYGKGVGQSPIPLMSMGGGGGFSLPDRFLYLTVLRYKLPSGRDINHKGVAPTVEVKAKTPSKERFLAAWKVRTSGAIEKYLDARWEEHKDAFKALAEADRFETSGYPGFDAFCGGLRSELTRDEIREELRRAIRRRFTVTEDVQYVCDLQTDLQLQYALVEMLDHK
jgi:C-terminal processing protease CtpA/Prc